jgi:multicomponent Na+:H+ antiporter subunit B
MSSVILKMASIVLRPLFWVISIWLLLRGHNHPGGGFIGGLIAGSALIIGPLSREAEEVKLGKKNYPLFFLSGGMILILLSAALGLFTSDLMLEGLWMKMTLPLVDATLKLGTPLMFDLGVYLAVIGFIYFIFNSMMEEWQWK